jgi:serine/threonine protein phosphatase 1
VAGIHFLDARGPEGMRIYAIGDVHGRLDLLGALHEQIAADLAATKPKDWRVIHLGDYTDRGPDSKGVLDFLLAATRRDKRMLALLGNHDDGLLEFLETPSAERLFANHGGAATARSYGVEIDFGSRRRLVDGHAALKKAVPAEHVRFIRSRPRSVAFGDFFFCHAGIRPGVPLSRQDPDDLILIRWEFLHHAGLHPKVVVHGHTPAVEPEVMANRINVDTGAFSTGVLSAVVIDGGEKTLIEAVESRV